MVKLIIWKPGRIVPRVAYFNEHAIGAIRIGRSTDNELIVLDSRVSRFHAHIKIGVKTLTLLDLSSTNGTYLKRAHSTRQVNSEHLLKGDKVIIADYIIEVAPELDNSMTDAIPAMRLVIDDTPDLTDPEYKIMDKPHPSQHSTPILTPSKHSLRKLINLILTTDSQLDAFCLDNFANVKSTFTNSMDRISKINILFEMEQPQIIAMYLMEFNSELYEQHKCVLQFSNQPNHT